MISSSEIRRYRHQASDFPETSKLLTRLKTARTQRSPFYLTRDEFEAIAHWKLGNQYGRAKRFLEANSPLAIRAATQACFSVTSENADYETEIRVGLLCALPGVGLGVASSILALVEPEEYGVIDFRVWHRLFGTDSNGFSIPSYKRYLAKLRQLARELGWTAQEVDHAIWEYDRRVGQGASV